MTFIHENRTPNGNPMKSGVGSGLCECGCGQATRISSITSQADGYVKGMPRRFLRGHNRSRLNRRLPVEPRFWAKVERGSPKECWPWLGCKSHYGHGIFIIDGRQGVASRFSYELHNGPIPAGLCVLHRCDNPPCVNPAHLFLGTRGDNTRDMVAKGRTLVGERNPNAKLTDDDVRAIRARATGRYGEDTAFGKEYGVTSGNIGLIKKGRIWKHVT